MFRFDARKSVVFFFVQLGDITRVAISQPTCQAVVMWVIAVVIAYSHGWLPAGQGLYETMGSGKEVTSCCLLTNLYGMFPFFLQMSFLGVLFEQAGQRSPHE